jgi:hypothetical protein
MAYSRARTQRQWHLKVASVEGVGNEFSCSVHNRKQGFLKRVIGVESNWFPAV